MSRAKLLFIVAVIYLAGTTNVSALDWYSYATISEGTITAESWSEDVIGGYNYHYSLTNGTNRSIDKFEVPQFTTFTTDIVIGKSYEYIGFDSRPPSLGTGYAYLDTGKKALLGIVRPGVVPEPISLILFVTGGTLLAGRRFIRRKV